MGDVAVAPQKDIHLDVLSEVNLDVLSISVFSIRGGKPNARPSQILFDVVAAPWTRTVKIDGPPFSLRDISCLESA